MSQHKLARVNVNQVHDNSLTLGNRIADSVADFSGSLTFLALNLALFALWIVVNTLLPARWHYDPYPFNFLTMSVSLEAIVLAIFVLISQNRQAAKDRIVAEADYHTNLAAKDEIEAILKHLDEQDQEILQVETRILEKLQEYMAKPPLKVVKKGIQ